MRVKFTPRFFIILGTLLALGALFASNALIKKRLEIKLIDEDADQVLAAADASKTNSNPYDLVESENLANPSEHQPVTISHTVEKGDSLASIATHYHADQQTIVDYPYNNVGDDLKISVGQVLIIPNGYIEGQPPPVLAQIPVGTGQFVWPLGSNQGKIAITQYSSWFHAGAIDIGSSTGLPVGAADNGQVKTVEHFTTGYGNHIIIDHGDGLTSLYAHLSQIRVRVGDVVSKGDLIGLSGSTGRSTGPHLHFEVKKNGAPVDPMVLLPGT